MTRVSVATGLSDDDFNHALLVAFAALGLVAVLSGWTPWAVRVVRRRHRTYNAPAPT
jgi:hypothetical protein